MVAGEHVELLLYQLAPTLMIPFYIARRKLKRIDSCFMGNRVWKGYNSAAYFVLQIDASACDKVKRVIEGYDTNVSLITFYNPL